MLRKIFKAILFVCVAAGSAKAGSSVFQKLSKIGPTSPSVAANTWGPGESASIIVAPSVSTTRNCLSRLTASVNAPVTLRILDGATTTYAVDQASATVIDLSWSNGDMCAAAGNYLAIKLSTFNVAGAAFTSQKMSYVGYTY